MNKIGTLLEEQDWKDGIPEEGRARRDRYRGLGQHKVRKVRSMREAAYI